MAFSPLEAPYSLRMVPSAAAAGSVAPMVSRYFWTAFSASRTRTITGLRVMKVTSSRKKPRSLWTA